MIDIAENKLADLSTDFAVRILKLTDSMKGHYSFVNQLEHSATSIGANIRETKYAHNKADFAAKLQIALKECYETEYWLERMQKTELLPEEIVKTYLHDCGAIRRMLIASANTVKTSQSETMPGYYTTPAFYCNQRNLYDRKSKFLYCNNIIDLL